ncbi:GGDEF domain-containing protein [Celeribacter baekdonensis]|uniref:GGDEF domain-containing protein n=1 Tax=Celeribacter baekdonensis TaxID=875171 RepID=UPI003A900AE6
MSSGHLNNQISRTLAEQLRISEVEIRERKQLLGLSQQDEDELASFHSVSIDIVDPIVDEFYRHQTNIPKISNIIGDSDTLGRLRSAMKGYILTLFEGKYDSNYVNSRLRIGKVHARIGVPPKLYVSSMHQLEVLLSSKLVSVCGLDEPPASIKKIFLFDLQFVFDTYIQGLVSEAELAHDELVKYSENLENIVAERTAKIELLAQTDDLTGLGNRRRFHLVAEQKLERTKRRQGTLALIFLDLDNFKCINDKQGHLAGDRILERVGKTIRDNLASNEVAFRFGGDEFCILVSDVDAESAQTLLQEHVARVQSQLHGDVGISAGLAFAGEGNSIELNDLIHLADKAMYADKTDPEKLPPPIGVEKPYGISRSVSFVSQL